MMPSATLPTSQRVLAPYVTRWSEEVRLPGTVIEKPGFGIAYADESVADRDCYGVLWERTSYGPGRGRPRLGKVHPARQRRAMQRLLCQVCGGPADRADDGVLWLLPDFRQDWPGWPDGMGVTEPPVCLPCVGLSIRMCPALRLGAVAFRARRFEIAGVRGALYRGGQAPTAVGDMRVSFDNPAIRWVRAANLLRELRDCSLVELDELG